MKYFLLLFFLGFSTSVYSQNVLINLTPPDTLYIQVDSSYNEPGYSASSPNGDITDSVKISSNLDTSAIGIYTIEYYVTDTGGNIIAMQVRIVYVIDTIPPYLVLIGDSLTNWPIGQFFTDPGFTVSDNYYDEQDVTVVIAGDYFDFAPKGCYYRCYQAEDASGNKTKWVTRIIDVGNSCTTFDYDRCNPVPPSPPASLEKFQTLPDVKIYPNPASKEIIIEGIADYKEVWLEFFDLEGKILSRAEITGKNQVSPPSCLSAGVYLLRLTADGKTMVKRQVVE